MKLALVMTATDKASKIIASMTNSAAADLARFEQRNKALRDSMLGMARDAGVMSAGAIAALAGPVKAYADLEDAAAGLKSVMMSDGGIVDTARFEKMNALATELGNKLPGNTADFYGMFTTMIKGGKQADQILGGLGKATAYLAVALKLPYEEAAKLSSKLSEATGVADAEMLQFLDIINRTTKLGVEAGEMQYAFGKSAGALKLLGLQGLESSKQLAPLYAQLIRTGASGETVGTNMSAVFNAMADAKKVGALNKALSKYGITMQFFDKAGNFMGIPNLIAQMDQLKDLTVEQRAAIMQAFVGPGQDAAFLQTIISNGVQGYNDIVKQMAARATLEQEVSLKLATLSATWEAITGTFTNILASIGGLFGPELKALTTWITDDLQPAIAAFVKNNPGLLRTIGIMIALVAAIGSIVAIGAGLMAFFNPVSIGITLVAGAIALLISYWGSIKKFFLDLYDWFENSGPLVKLLLYPITILYYTFKLLAAGVQLLIQHWDKISSAFMAIWDITSIPIKALMWMFSSIWDLFNRADQALKDGGKNLVASLTEGIKSAAAMPIQAVMDMVQGIRNLLPFSPAKDGPLRDIHRIQLVETIASAIKPQPMVNAMQGVMSQVAGPAPVAGLPAMGQGGGGSIVFSPTINVTGASPTAAADVRKQIEAMLPEFANRLDEMARLRQRRAFTTEY